MVAPPPPRVEVIAGPHTRICLGGRLLELGRRSARMGAALGCAPGRTSLGGPSMGAPGRWLAYEAGPLGTRLERGMGLRAGHGVARLTRRSPLLHVSQDLAQRRPAGIEQCSIRRNDIGRSAARGVPDARSSRENHRAFSSSWSLRCTSDVSDAVKPSIRMPEMARAAMNDIRSDRLRRPSPRDFRATASSSDSPGSTNPRRGIAPDRP